MSDERSDSEEGSKFSTLEDRIVEWLSSQEATFHFTSDGLTPNTTAFAADLAARYEAEHGSDEEVESVGPWRLGRRLGRGGSGEVREAVHSESGERVALKLAVARPSAVEALKREAEALLAIDHPHVLGCSGFGVDDGYAWVATELIQGRTLARWLDSRKDRDLDSDELRRVMTWFRDLAGALQVLHGAGRIHRDLKPANVMITDEDRAVLIDFGLSIASEENLEGWLAGTVAYMSPEQTLAGYVDIGPGSDVYALAITFHEALTGRRVVSAHQRRAILEQVAFVGVPAPSTARPSLPRSLDPIFLRATAKNARDRHRDAGELAQDLEAWLGGKRLAEATRRFRPRRWKQRAALLGAACLIVLLGLIANHLVVSARRDAALERVAASREASDPLGILEEVANEAGDDEVVQAVLRERIAELAPGLARSFLARQAFGSPGSPREEEQRLLRRIARLEELRPDPYLRFCRAFAAVRDGRFEAAERLLSEASEDHLVLRELRVVSVLLRSEACPIPPELQQGSGGLGELELCLRAFRISAQILLAKAGVGEAPANARVREIEERLRDLWALPDRSRRRLPGTLLARLALERGRWKEARQVLGSLREDAAHDDERASIDLLRARAFLFEGSGAPADPEEAAACARAALTLRPALWKRLPAEIAALEDWQRLLDFLVAVLPEPAAAEGVELPATLSSLAAWCGHRAFEVRDDAAIQRLAACVLALPARRDPAVLTARAQLRTSAAWSAFYAMAALREPEAAARAAEAVIHLAEAPEAEVAPVFAYQLAMVALEAEARVALLTEDPAWVARARKRLERLADEAFQKAALQDAESDEQREVINGGRERAARIADSLPR